MVLPLGLIIVPPPSRTFRAPFRARSRGFTAFAHVLPPISCSEPVFSLLRARFAPYFVLGARVKVSYRCVRVKKVLNLHSKNIRPYEKNYQRSPV